jgi:uncharacterized protein YjbI with pentapeptide repeats
MRATTSSLMIAISLCLPTAIPASAQQQKEWTWKDRDQRVKSAADLDEILRHKLSEISHDEHWSRIPGLLSGTDLRGAKLGGADLSEADLSGADLSEADLSGADLSQADLSGAKLVGADLSGAKLDGAHLSTAYLLVDVKGADLLGSYLSKMYPYGADLSHADLSGAKLVGADLGDADLTGAKLVGADLSGAKLDGAHLSGANVEDADLSRASLRGADLSRARLGGVHLNGAFLSDADLTGGAFLYDADLSDAHLIGADLQGADLSAALLTHADLSRADLSGTNLSGADVSRSDLSGADLDNADLRVANLSGTLFQPKNLPVLEYVALARGLERMTYGNNPGLLTQLRKQFQDAGYREQERAITCALNRRQAQRDIDTPPYKSSVEGLFKWLAFDLTSEYGFSPGRPLRIVGLLWLLFSLVYAGFIHLRGTSGIYLVGTRSYRGTSYSQALQIRPEPIRTTKWWKKPWLWLGREWHVLRAAMFFSLMSAFNIGFRDINFGRWLRLLTKREYDLNAVGWARTVSGFQSLLSVYFIALWVLTYFGRPFG